MQAIARPLTRAAPRGLRQAAALSTWSAVPAGPPDPILGEFFNNIPAELANTLPRLQAASSLGLPVECATCNFGFAKAIRDFSGFSYAHELGKTLLTVDNV